MSCLVLEEDVNQYVFDAVPIIGISRHRLLTDGGGITTLVAFHKCPLHCVYCLNRQCNNEDGIQRYVTPKSIYKELMRDDIYFRSTGGGVCFGGGEPLLRYAFIKEFKKHCGDNWRISIETSLNVPQKNVSELVDIIDEYIIDIKDMSEQIYTKYTGASNSSMLTNLRYLIDKGQTDKMFVRVPLIPGYNKEKDVENSIELLKLMGLTRFDRFAYVTEKISNKDKPDDSSKVPVGKAICEVLKEVRLTIANANAICYEPAVCNHKGNCPGTCPRCEYELNTLSEELWKRESEGKRICL